jgi:hypothetical protein
MKFDFGFREVLVVHELEEDIWSNLPWFEVLFA